MHVSGSVPVGPDESLRESVEDLLLRYNTGRVRDARQLAELCWEAGFNASKMRAYRWIAEHRCDNRDCMSTGILEMTPDDYDELT